MRNRAILFAVGAIMVLLGGCAGTSKAPPSVQGESAVAVQPILRISAQEKSILQNANNFRQEQGVKPLRPNPKLMDIARRHAANMANKDRYGDSDKNGHIMDGMDPAARVQVGGYAFARVAENVGWQLGREDPAVRMVEDWKKSPGHRRNLLIVEVVDTGVGAAKGRSGRWYFVQLFGKPFESARRQSAKLTPGT